MPIQHIKRFLQLESAGGIILFGAAVLAMVWANSPLAYLHQQFINQFLFLINDGLMALFFLVIGIELKTGYLEGQLSRLSQVILPLFAALGGMLIPALIYAWVNYGDPVSLKAWSTPVATDIAFALGVLSLFGSRVPLSLKLFLLSLAVFDDIGAIVIISCFYSANFSLVFFLLSLLVLLMLTLLNVFSVRSLIPYILLGLCLWVFLLKSGVHPTIAGVLFALTIPANSDPEHSLLHKLNNALHPWVAFVIMPLFALANAGFSLHELTRENLAKDIVFGITLGLFFGKQVGVFLFSWVLIKAKLAKLPLHCTWLELYGVALLCGIGFTMSLFLGTLSFANESVYLAEVRLGVILGSLLSGLFGAIILLFALRNSSNKQVLPTNKE